MIKVEYSKGDLKIQLKMPESVYISNSNKIYKLLSDVLDELSEPTLNNGNKEQSNPMPLRGNISDKVFNFRERIPNTIESDTVKVQQPKLDKTLVRCPKCGQGYCAIVKINEEEMRLMVKKGGEFKTTKTVIKTDAELNDMLCPDTVDKKDYYDDIMSVAEVLEDEKDMFVDLDTKLICPCCHTDNNFSEWKKAFDTPELYFDYSDVCDICGGEVETVVTGKGSKKVCNTCNTEKDNRKEN